MKILSEYIEEHKLLLNKWVGQWSKKEYKKAIDSFNKLGKTTDIKNIIQDITDLDFDINSIELIDWLVEIRKKIKDTDFKVVYITGKPQDVVFSHLYAEGLQNTNSYRSCSTINKALDLLQISLSLSDLEDKISKLKRNSDI